MKKIKTKYWLILILLLATVLRFYRLGTYPPLNADEAAIGYDAYSILETGKDEHGDWLPIHFKSFGDYKPGAYFYMVMPLVKLLGLNEWAVRLPSAVFAILTIYLVYQLGVLLWRSERLGLIWAVVLAVSPWHLQFSRGGWESNTALFLMVLGVWAFFRFRVGGKTGWIYLSGLSFVLSLYTYHSLRVVLPVFLLGLALFNLTWLWKERKRFIWPILLSAGLLVPLLVSFLGGGASARFAGVGLLSDVGPLSRVNELLNQHEGKGLPGIRLIHNRYLIYAIAGAEKYFSHFNGRFLFIDGDDVPRSRLPEMGTMHYFELFFLVLGLVVFLRKKTKYKYLPFLWLLVAPLASAMTFQAPSALRSLPMVIPLTFLVAVGIDRLWDFKWLRGLILVVYLWGLVYWQNDYFVHYLKRYPSAWPGGVKEIVEQLKQSGNTEPVCISGDWDQPYILALFYLQYPPELIQKEIQLTPPDQFGFSTVERFDRYQFGNCDNFPGKIIQ
ncbi:MAG: glycosyltransferase family 39 protein [Patescibacteria group bacterium]